MLVLNKRTTDTELKKVYIRELYNCIDEMFFGDLLHPHHAGYELWRDAVMPKFAEMLKMP